MTNSQATSILSKTRRRLLVLLIAMMAAILVIQAFVGTPSALALDRVADQTWNVAGTVFTQALSKDGETLYIGGKFTKVRENPPGEPGATVLANNVAAIEVATGAADPAWTPDVTGIVRSLAVKDGKVFIGGTFTAVEGEPRQNLAAVDAVDGSVEPFAPQISKTNTNPLVYALLPGDTKLYVGGLFNSVDGKTRANLAAFDLATDATGTTGTLDSAWKPKTNNRVRDLKFASDRATIFAAGRFTNVTGSDRGAGRRESVARLQTDTGNLDPWKIQDGVVGAPQQCFDLVATPTMLYAGCGAGPNFAAAFHLAPGNPVLDGTRAWRFNTVGNVQAVALSPDSSRLFLGGHFGTNQLEQQVCTPRQNLSGLVSVNPATGQPICDWIPELAPSVNNGNGAWDLTISGGSHLWVGGGFTHVSGVDQRNLARFTL